MSEKKEQKLSMYERGFKYFARDHYLYAISRALDITNMASHEVDLDGALFEITYRVILERLTSPIVYLREKWDKMAFQEKAKYDPELAKAAEELNK